MAKEFYRVVRRPAHLIAKLEKPQALEELDKILEATDAVMVARGDLGVELNAWQVPVAQKRIIEAASRWRRPVITATQMLESMIHAPLPTRAEASDVANAVFDGSDCLMLSGETAVGKYPAEAVRMMSKIIETAEEYRGAARLQLGPSPRPEDAVSAEMAHSAARLAEKLEASYIAVYSETGYSARLISKHHPTCPIAAFSRHTDVCQRMKLLWGVRSKPVGEVQDFDALGEVVDTMLQELRWVAPGDRW